jgi:hypothetical protein
MNLKNFSKIIFGFVILTGAQMALAGQRYELTLTNGSQMPISAGVVYAINGQNGISEIGGVPSPGLIRLCQMGDPSIKFTEVQADKNVSWVAKTPGPILPGQTVTVEVDVDHPHDQSVHFEAMYGKSKEVCASIRVGSQSLRSLAAHSEDEVIDTDHVISAGAATEPMIPSGAALTSVCQNATTAIDCLRALTTNRTGGMQIHSFAGYLPSVLDFLESKYGGNDVLTLFVPHSGAVNYSIKRK